MRRAGANPTDVEVTDIINKVDNETCTVLYCTVLHCIINKVDNETGALDFAQFCSVMQDRNKNVDLESSYKETFRVFSKDDDGCIPAAEIRFAIIMMMMIMMIMMMMIMISHD